MARFHVRLSSDAFRLGALVTSSPMYRERLRGGRRMNLALTDRRSSMVLRDVTLRSRRRVIQFSRCEESRDLQVHSRVEGWVGVQLMASRLCSILLNEITKGLLLSSFNGTQSYATVESGLRSVKVFVCTQTRRAAGVFESFLLYRFCSIL